MAKCKCGHAPHEKTCQEPRKYAAGWMACGCFYINGKLPPGWHEYTPDLDLLAAVTQRVQMKGRRG